MLARGLFLCRRGRSNRAVLWREQTRAAEHRKGVARRKYCAPCPVWFGHGYSFQQENGTHEQPPANQNHLRPAAPAPEYHDDCNIEEENYIRELPGVCREAGANDLNLESILSPFSLRA